MVDLLIFCLDLLGGEMGGISRQEILWRSLYGALGSHVRLTNAAFRRPTRPGLGSRGRRSPSYHQMWLRRPRKVGLQGSHQRAKQGVRDPAPRGGEGRRGRPGLRKRPQALSAATRGSRNPPPGTTSSGAASSGATSTTSTASASTSTTGWRTGTASSALTWWACWRMAP